LEATRRKVRLSRFFYHKYMAGLEPPDDVVDDGANDGSDDEDDEDEHT
jgi:hypothetical protein